MAPRIVVTSMKPRTRGHADGIVRRRDAGYAFLGALFVACGGDPSSPDVTTGSMEVAVSVSGADIPATYTVDVVGRSISENPQARAKITALPATIAYTGQYCPWYYGCAPSIYLEKLSGEADRLSGALGDRPSWSPDGRKIAYNGVICDYYYYYYYECDRVGVRVSRIDGTSAVDIVKGHSPTWRPRR